MENGLKYYTGTIYEKFFRVVDRGSMIYEAEEKGFYDFVNGAILLVNALLEQKDEPDQAEPSGKYL